jgi:phosphoribosylamine--glycine ligase
MSTKKVMIIGSGGREHALAWKALQSPHIEEVLVVPGNAGTALEPGLRNVEVNINDFSALAQLAQTEQIGLTIVGPEAPLVDGLVDYFANLGLPCFGPNKLAAQLEGSKGFTKDFLKRHQIPTAAYGNFNKVEDALAYLEEKSLPIVIKADGLAAGKGVVIAQTLEEAKSTVVDMLSGNSFGSAGYRVVIEEFMQGEEASFIALVDGTVALPFATSQDHKAIYDEDRGPNTGGMGAYSPAPVVTSEIHQRVMDEIIMPTVRGMAAEGNTYKGFLYAGLMIDAQGAPRVVEFNCRFGDPEAQPIMMRLKSDLVELCLAAIDGKLEGHTLEFDQRAALAVVLAASGYPGDYSKGANILGLDSEAPEHTKVFHAGTRLVEGSCVTHGGRVLTATALGDTVNEAQHRAYKLVSLISWDGMTFRKDIGWRAIARELGN